MNLSGKTPRGTRLQRTAVPIQFTNKIAPEEYAGKIFVIRRKLSGGRADIRLEDDLTEEWELLHNEFDDEYFTVM